MLHPDASTIEANPILTINHSAVRWVVTGWDVTFDVAVAKTVLYDLNPDTRILWHKGVNQRVPQPLSERFDLLDWLNHGGIISAVTPPRSNPPYQDSTLSVRE